MNRIVRQAVQAELNRKGRRNNNNNNNNNNNRRKNNNRNNRNNRARAPARASSVYKADVVIGKESKIVMLNPKLFVGKGDHDAKSWQYFKISKLKFLFNSTNSMLNAKGEVGVCLLDPKVDSKQLLAMSDESLRAYTNSAGGEIFSAKNDTSFSLATPDTPYKVYSTGYGDGSATGSDMDSQYGMGIFLFGTDPEAGVGVVKVTANIHFSQPGMPTFESTTVAETISLAYDKPFVLSTDDDKVLLSNVMQTDTYKFSKTTGLKYDGKIFPTQSVIGDTEVDYQPILEEINQSGSVLSFVDLRYTQKPEEQMLYYVDNKNFMTVMDASLIGVPRSAYVARNQPTTVSFKDDIVITN